VLFFSLHKLIFISGNQTKLLKSSQRSSNKTALIEKSINRDVIFSSIILIILSLISAGLSIQWGQSFGDQWMFITFLTYNPFENIANHFIALILTFMIMYQVMIPVALYVSLDLVRILQIYSISIDKQFQYEHPINCRTFTINEDLGQIGYIFSDKTGTLTQNKLLFKAMSIDGILYSQRY
jgi:magnesium-transporting ATPase (P-type)